MEQRAEPRSRKHSHEGRAFPFYVVALGAVLLGADAGAQQLIAPQFISTPVTSVNEQAVYSYDIVVIDVELPDTVAITAPTQPAWLTFTDNGNRTASLSGVPTQAQVGVHSVVLQASDGVNASQQTFTITVSNVNDAPAFTSTPSTTVGEGSSYSYAMTAADADGDPLTFAAPTLPAWLSFNGANAVSGTPLQAHVGSHTVVVTVSDGTAPPVQQSFTITVANNPDPPTVVTPIPDQSAAEGAAFGPVSVAANFSDPDGDPLTFSASGFPGNSGLSMTSGGVISGTPTDAAAQASPFNVTVTATATDGAVTDTFTFTVTNANDAPNAVADAYTTAEDTTLNVAAPGVLGNDTDTDPGTTLTAVLDRNVSNGTLTLNANGSFTYAPNPNFSGADSFTYHANDGSAAGNIVTVAIAISAVNDPPRVTSTPPATVNEDASYRYSVAATDPDGNLLTILAPTLPPWLVFTAPATISGSPAETDVGQHSVTMTVSDGIAPPVEHSFQVTVRAVDDAPVIAAIPDQMATELVPFSLNLATFVTDADTPATRLVFTSMSPLPAGLALAANGVLSGIPLAAGIGDFLVRFRVSDGPNTVQATPPLNLTVLRAGRGDVALSVVAAPNPVPLNTAATWTFTIKNNAPLVDVGGITLQAVFTCAVSFEFDNPTAECTLTPSAGSTNLSCTLGPLAGGATTSVALTGRGTVAGDVFVSASVAIVGPVPIDDTPRNDSASTSLSVGQSVSTTPAQSIEGLYARAAAAGDLNGDGFVDLAVVTGVSQVASVLMNVVDPANANKRALATVPTILGGQGTANGIALADLDGDQDLDVVTAMGLGTANRIFLNSGTATFTATTLGDPAEDSRAVAAGDVNGDSLTDLVFANGGTSAVYTAQGSAGHFVRAALPGTADRRGVVVVDLFGSTLPEIVFANGDGDASVYGNTGGAFQLALTVPTGPTTSVAAADFNNDQRVDLVFGRGTAATPGAAPSDPVWLNTSGSTGSSFSRSDELGASPTAAVLAADINLDGAADVLAINDTGAHQIYTNVAASGTFALHPQQIGRAGTVGAAVSSFGSDSRVDAALVGPAGVDVFYNDGAGNLGSGDITGPTIQLRGDATVTLNVQVAYVDAGATATDTVDGDVTSRVTVTNPVNSDVVGTYTVTYNATDLSGNAAQPVTRTVVVQAREQIGGGGGGAVSLELVLLLAFAAALRRAARGPARRVWLS